MAIHLPDPVDLYTQRLRELNEIKAAALRREKILGIAKVILAGLTVLFAFWLMRHTRLIELIAAPIVLYIVLAVFHEKLLRSIRLHSRAIEFYERGLGRLQDRWAGHGETGDRFLDPAHVCARDLDLFGSASLFELLSTARTRAGEETLAAWLLTPAPVPEILSRQAALRDLAPRITFRESLFLLGETVRAGVHPDALAAWGERKPAFPARSLRIATPLLALLWIAGLVAWGLWDFWWLAALLTLVNLGWSRHLLTRLTKQPTPQRTRRKIWRCSPALSRFSNVNRSLRQNSSNSRQRLTPAMSRLLRPSASSFGSSDTWSSAAT